MSDPDDSDPWEEINDLIDEAMEEVLDDEMRQKMRRLSEMLQALEETKGGRRH